MVKDDAERNARPGPLAERNEKEGEGMGERQCRETRRRPGAMGQMGGRNRQGRGTAENNSLDEQARNEETAQGGEDRSGLRAEGETTEGTDGQGPRERQLSRALGSE